jgi:hypothetical protein
MESNPELGRRKAEKEKRALGFKKTKKENERYEK